MSNATAKMYYCTTPGSTYIDKAGEIHTFLGGQLTTSDPAVQADLDTQIARGVTHVRVAKMAAPDAAAIAAKLAIEKKAEIAAALAAAGATKHLPQQPAVPQ